MARPTITIRQFEGGDTAQLRRIVAEMQEFERGIDARLLPGDAMAEGYTDSMLRRCAEHGGMVLVAVAGGEPIGFVGVACAVPSEELDEPPGPYALVTDLAVTASHRSKGVGRALLTGAEAYARSRGATELRIAVLSDNAPARSLYRSAGFRPYLEILRKDLDA